LLAGFGGCLCRGKEWLAKGVGEISGLIDKIEKFEIYIKNSNFFEGKYKEAIVDITKYIKKYPLEVLFNQEFVKLIS